MAFPIFVTLLFLISPFFSLFFVVYGLFKSTRYKRYYGFLFALAVGLLVYHIVPTVDLDLYRYYTYLDQLQSNGFLQSISHIWGESDPLSYSFMFVVSSIFNNNAITLLSALIGYCVIFYIIFDYSKLKALDVRNTGILLLLFIASYSIINSFTGIRFALGVCIFLLALYLDVIKKQRTISTILYIISPLFHTSMITLLMIRVAALSFKKSTSLFQYIFIFIIGISTAFLQQISQILSSVPFLNILSSRADVYLQPVFPSGFWYPFNVVVTILLITLLFCIRKKNIINPMILKVNLYVLIVALANVMNFYIANRYIIVGALLFVISFTDIISYLKESSFFATRRILLYISFTVYLAVVIIYLSYQVTYLKQMDYENLTPYSLLENIFTLLAR